MKIVENEHKLRSHGCILEHIRDDKETNHTSSYVYLIKLRYATISACYCNIFQGDVQIIFRYTEKRVTVEYQLLEN